MKRFITILLGLIIALCAYGQNLQDVVYLKSGGVVRGLIIEQIPGSSLSIKTSDGSLFVYSMKDVARITKEPAKGAAKKQKKGTDLPLLSWKEGVFGTGQVKFLADNSYEISRDELSILLGEEACRSLFQAKEDYKSGSMWEGMATLSGCIAIPFLVVLLERALAQKKPSAFLLIGAGITVPLSIIGFSVGVPKLNAAKREMSMIMDDYNQSRYGKYSDNIKLDLSPTVLAFSNNGEQLQFAPGITFSLKF